MVSPAQRKIKRWLEAPGEDPRIQDGFSERMVPKAGLEPARVAPHAPQTCASTNSATWAQRTCSARPVRGGTPADRWILPRSQRGVFAGAAGFAGAGTAGLAGAVFVAAAFALPCPVITVPPTPPLKRAIDTVVRMKITNEDTVSLCNSVVALRAPKAVWVLPPPKTERSAPLPCCNRTTRIRNTQTMTCSAYSR